MLFLANKSLLNYVILQKLLVFRGNYPWVIFEDKLSVEFTEKLSLKAELKDLIKCNT